MNYIDIKVKNIYLECNLYKAELKYYVLVEKNFLIIIQYTNFNNSHKQINYFCLKNHSIFIKLLLN